MICWSAVWIDPREIESRLTIKTFSLVNPRLRITKIRIFNNYGLYYFNFLCLCSYSKQDLFQLIKTNKKLIMKPMKKNYGLQLYFKYSL